MTSAIRQDGANQVSIITNTAERTAAVEFAKAAAMRPQIVGGALNRISEDPEIEAALFEVLETQKLIDGEARLTLMPRGNELLAQLLAVDEEPARQTRRLPRAERRDDYSQVLQPGRQVQGIV